MYPIVIKYVRPLSISEVAVYSTDPLCSERLGDSHALISLHRGFHLTIILYCCTWSLCYLQSIYRTYLSGKHNLSPKVGSVGRHGKRSAVLWSVWLLVMWVCALFNDIITELAFLLMSTFLAFTASCILLAFLKGNYCLEIEHQNEIISSKN